jgi:hypothetical protein
VQESHDFLHPPSYGVTRSDMHATRHLAKT